MYDEYIHTYIYIYIYIYLFNIEYKIQSIEYRRDSDSSYELSLQIPIYRLKVITYVNHKKDRQIKSLLYGESPKEPAYDLTNEKNA